MKAEELSRLINIEFAYLDITNTNIGELLCVINDSAPDKIQVAAMTKFIAEFYNGTENILKRICKFKKITLPHGGFYHTELFQCFCEPPKNDLPLLFDDNIFNDYIGMLKFRHYLLHGYAFQIKWERIKASISNIDLVYEHFKSNVNMFINSII